MSEPQISLAELRPVGRDLQRPECVLCTVDGSLFVSDWGGGVCHIRPDRTQQRILAVDAPCEIRPNGIALLHDGSFLLANLADEGGIWRLQRDGSVAPYLTEVDGERLPPSNFVAPDRQGRVWVSVSTRQRPRSRAYRADVRDGFIAVVDRFGPRIVADGLGYTNEVQVDPSGDFLYVNETFARRLSRLPIATDGSLGELELVAEFDIGVFPDGLQFDVEGGVWIVSIVSNRVIRIAPDGHQQVIIDDACAEHVARVERAFAAARMGRAHLDQAAGNRLANISSIAFGGSDRRSCYLGCLLGGQLMSFRSPWAGVEPVHWHVR